ncbi:DUF7847 domain-containing protein [Halogranum rubrum]|uniref:DUF7847 domain-containing protein n=1 Tax=Halogranum salarium B-1 TaxID=1210908 RepID=J3JI31_9EURY|nr:hypothetical protein [Halogranum salarium]EJN61519.1 hypothetical protein HSB1_05600 [Halogranum salarium B-1]
MVALHSLSTAFQTIARRPTLVLPAAVLGLISVLSVVAQGSVWALLVSLAQLVAIPFVVAGFVALVEDARPGGRETRGFVAAGKRYFLTVLGGNVLLGIVMVIIAGILLVTAILALGGFDAVFHGEFAITPVSVGIVGVVGILGWLVSLLFRFFVPAVVVEDRRVGDALGRSVEFVTGNFLSVVGFALVAETISLVLGLLPMWYFLYGAPTSVDEFVAAAGPSFAGTPTPLSLAILFLTGVVASLVGQTYLVCFFGECTDAQSDRPSTTY